MDVEALNCVYQPAVARFIYWNMQYSEALRNTEDNAIELRQAAFNKARSLFNALPKDEQDNVSKFVDTDAYQA